MIDCVHFSFLILFHDSLYCISKLKKRLFHAWFLSYLLREQCFQPILLNHMEATEEISYITCECSLCQLISKYKRYLVLRYIQ